jgi:Sugar kinases, ribokinase family
MKTALVIGGINVDIWGSPAGELQLHDSNPGHVRLKAGGVGRNIAHNLSLLGVRTSMLTALGGDSNSDFLISSCSSAGIDLSLSERFPDKTSSVYMYITDGRGDMCAAVSDMDIVNLITPSFLSARISDINSFDAVVIDGNLRSDAIKFIADNCTVPIYADPVSAAKAPSLLPVLNRLQAIKPNAIEAYFLSGIDKPEEAARWLKQFVPGKVFISLGVDGIFASDGNLEVFVPSIPVQVINTTGAGDAATAAIVYGGIMDLSLEATASLAVKAGAVTSACSETNSPEISLILK